MLGKYNELEICKEVSFGYYLNSSEGELLLPTNEVTSTNLEVGQKITVFIYKDSEDRFIATERKPKAILGEFAYLIVNQVNQTGAFMDWGLLKDLLVPYSEQHTRMHQDQGYIVKICLDPQSERLIGVGKIGAFLETEEINLEPMQEVDLWVYDISELGYSCIIDGTYSGILYQNEVFTNLSVGDKLKGYVKKLRDDNKIDLSIKPLGYSLTIPKSAEEILEKLKNNNGFLPFNDRTDADTIKLVFKMSKKAFKKACGLLYREKILLIEPKGITLIKNDFINKD